MRIRVDASLSGYLANEIWQLFVGDRLESRMSWTAVSWRWNHNEHFRLAGALLKQLDQLSVIGHKLCLVPLILNDIDPAEEHNDSVGLGCQHLCRLRRERRGNAFHDGRAFIGVGLHLSLLLLSSKQGLQLSWVRFEGSTRYFRAKCERVANAGDASVLWRLHFYGITCKHAYR